MFNYLLKPLIGFFYNWVCDTDEPRNQVSDAGELRNRVCDTDELRKKPPLTNAESQAPEWWVKKVPPTSANGTIDDLLLSIRYALTLTNVNKGNIVFGVPEDNLEVMEALIKAGGEIRITIRCAPRPILEMLSSESQPTSAPNVAPNSPTVNSEGLEGTFFSGGQGG